MPNVARFAIEWDVDGGWEGVATFHTHKGDSASPYSEGELEDACAAVAAWWTDDDESEAHPWSETRSGWPATFRVVRVTARAILPVLGDEVALTLPVEDQPGTAAYTGDGFITPQMCVVVTLRTALGSRRGRGRMFWPAQQVIYGFTPETTGGFIDGANLENYANFAAHLAAHIADLPGSGVEQTVMAVYSRVDEDARSVLSFALADRMATQRRRRLPVAYHAFGLDGELIV